jgi:signal peptidase I
MTEMKTVPPASAPEGNADYQPEKGKVREYVEAFAVALVIALIVRTLLLQAFRIPSSSMENTLLIGDHIFVNKFIYGYHIPFTKGRTMQITHPKLGDIVVFVYPEDKSKDFIKRIIGTPGDTVEIRNKVVYVNGKPIKEEYTRFADGAEIDTFARQRDNLPPITVPPGKYFALGDNRDRSYDSRFWGFVEEDALIGKAIFIYFSIDLAALPHWYEVWNYPSIIRWSRFGHLLH